MKQALESNKLSLRPRKRQQPTKSKKQVAKTSTKKAKARKRKASSETETESEKKDESDEILKNEEGKYTCSHCERSFLSKSELVEHERN